MTTIAMPKDLEIYSDENDPTVEGDIKSVLAGAATEISDCDSLDDATTSWRVSIRMAFSSGSQKAGPADPAPGDTLTGHTSGATAVIRYVHVTSGTFGAGTAAGYFWVYNLGVANFQDTETLDIGADINIADCDTSLLLATEGYTLAVDEVNVKEGTGSIVFQGPGFGAVVTHYYLLECVKDAGSWVLSSYEQLRVWLRNYYGNINHSFSNFYLKLAESTDPSTWETSGAVTLVNNVWKDESWDISALGTDIDAVIAFSVQFSMVSPVAVSTPPRFNVDYVRCPTVGEDTIKGVLNNEVVTIYPVHEQVRDTILATDEIAWADEFLRGNTNANNIGDHGWDMNANGEITLINGTVGHPGVIQFGTNATTDNLVAGLYLGGWDAEDFVYFGAWVKNVSTATMTVKIGMTDTVNEAADAPEGMYFYYKSADTNIWCVTRNPANITSTDTGLDWATPAWLLLEMIIVPATSVAFYVNGTLEATHTTNISATGTSLYPSFVVQNTTTAKRSIYIDWFGIRSIASLR